MRVLIVGGGAREHALAWKLAQSPRCGEIIVAPGNAGTGAAFRNAPVSVNDIVGLVALAETERVDLAVIGPEEPLARGLADALTERGIPAFGPGQAGATIESSKAWAKSLMQTAGVAMPRATVYTELDDALAALDEANYPIVVKADGLAAGKGVAVCATRREAASAIGAILEAGLFGKAEMRILIEDYLEGDEVSVLALVDGETVVPLLPARDHKRVGDGDTGPNTGGMGAYAPTRLMDDAMQARILAEVLQPTARALAERGIAYQGVLYAGLMLTASGPQVIEFNCRMGDPETQVILPLLNADWLTLCHATATGSLSAVADTVRWHPGACAGVVLASGGYPGAYDTGIPVNGLDAASADALVFHAGTATNDAGETVTSGGRVLTVCAAAPTLAAARDCAYAAAKRITFDGVQYRRDIAAREIPQE